MMNVKSFVFISALFYIGCSATQLAYQPQEHTEISKSIDILKSSLKHQSPNHFVTDIEINLDFFKVVSGPRNRTRYIHFENIKKIELHEKSEWEIVTIRGEHNSILYRLYVQDKTIAKDFINAVYTLKNHPNELELELNRITALGPDNYRNEESIVLPENTKQQEKIDSLEGTEEFEELDDMKE